MNFASARLFFEKNAPFQIRNGERYDLIKLHIAQAKLIQSKVE